MLKSTIIATCLVNSNMINRVEDAEAAVRQVFEESYPEKDFAAWNVEVDDRSAEWIISGVGRASTVNVKRLIADLG